MAPACGNLELYEVAGVDAVAHTHARPDAYALEQEGTQEKFRASPPWLRSLSFLARRDLEGDLQILREKFGLALAELVETRKHGLPTGLAVDISGGTQAVEAAKGELVEGILQYYGTQVEWSASELPAEPDEEPPARSVSTKRPLELEALEAEPMQEVPQPSEKEPAPEPSEFWDKAPTAGEVAWGDAPEAAEVSWDEGPEILPGLREALQRVDAQHLVAGPGGGDLGGGQWGRLPAGGH